MGACVTHKKASHAHTCCEQSRLQYCKRFGSHFSCPKAHANLTALPSPTFLEKQTQ